MPNSLPKQNMLLRQEEHRVVTMPDKPAGRGQKLSISAVKKYALEHDLPLLQPVKLKDPEFIESPSVIVTDSGINLTEERVKRFG